MESLLKAQDLRAFWKATLDEVRKLIEAIKTGDNAAIGFGIVAGIILSPILVPFWGGFYLMLALGATIKGLIRGGEKQ